MNWQALWKPRWERSLREVLVFPLIILIMLVPLGLFTGGYTSLLHSSLSPLICNGHPCPITDIIQEIVHVSEAHACNEIHTVIVPSMPVLRTVTETDQGRYSYGVSLL